jgi:hypothetical protein
LSALVIKIDFQADEAIRDLAGYQAALKDKTGLHKSMAQGVEAAVSDHLLGLNSRSPNTSFYGRAARSTQVTADDGQGLVSITHRGLALRYYGGRVLPVNVKNLAIPSDDVPLAGNEGRLRPKEMGVLAFIPKRGMDVSATTGYLVEGEEKTITRGKNKGGKRIVPKAGGKLLYTLRAWTDHNADESVIPSTAVLLASAKDAGEYYIESATQNRGDS